MVWHPSVDGLLKRAFRRYGRLAFRFRFLLIAFPLLTTACLAPGLFLFKDARLNTNVSYIYSPSDGPHIEELNAYRSRWPSSSGNFVPTMLGWAETPYLDVMVWTDASDGNILQHLPEVARLERWLSRDVRVQVYDQRINRTAQYSYEALCASYLGYCLNNEENMEFLRDHEAKGDAIEARVRAKAEKRRGGTKFIDFVFGEGGISRFYSDLFDVRYPTSRRQSFRIPVWEIISGTDAVTSVDFVDVTAGDVFHEELLNQLKTKLVENSAMNLTAEQEEQLESARRTALHGSEDELVRVRAARRELRRLQDELAPVLGKFTRATTVRLFFAVDEGASVKARAGLLWLDEAIALLSNGSAGNLQYDTYYRSRLSDSAHKFSALAYETYVFVYLILAIFAVLCGFVVFRRVSDDRLAVDWLRSKATITSSGVVSGGLASLSSYGLLLYIGVPWNGVALVVMFILVAIGVDDMFVISGAWLRSNRSLSPEERMGETLAHSAVAVTLTSVTDALSFAVGCWTNIPFVWIFCSYTAVGVVFNYVYQLTLFVGLLGVWGDVEARGRHSATLRPIRPDAQGDSCVQRHLASGSVRRGDTATELHKGDSGRREASIVSTFFRSYYGPFILHPASRVLALLAFLFYIAGAIYGLVHIKIGLDAAQLVVPTPEDSDGLRYYRQMMGSFWWDGDVADLLFTKLPDLSVTENRVRINATTQDFLYTPHTRGNESVCSPLWRFERYWNTRPQRVLRNKATYTWEFYSRLREDWMPNDEEKAFWGKSLHWASDERTPDCDNRTASFDQLCDFHRLASFRLRIATRHMPDSERQALLLNGLREAADRHPEFGILPMINLLSIIQGSASIPGATMWNLCFISIGLFLVALVMIPSYVGIALVTASVASIDAGVIGYLSLWGVGMDQVSGVCVLLAAGLSVNLTAHITHAFIAAEGPPRERVLDALADFGAPILQGGLSTFLGNVYLGFQTHYISKVFFRTVLLCQLFGLAHALLLLPVALASLVPLCPTHAPKDTVHPKQQLK